LLVSKKPSDWLVLNFFLNTFFVEIHAFALDGSDRTCWLDQHPALCDEISTRVRLASTGGIGLFGGTELRIGEIERALKGTKTTLMEDTHTNEL
jgi:hypothetical protein